MGIAAMALGVLALAAVAVGALAVVTHGFRRHTVITYRPNAVFRLRAGDCVDNGAGLSAQVVSCDVAHDAEIFATFGLPGKAAWPGETAVQQQASQGCVSRVSGYVNPQLAAASLTQEYVYPDQTAWQAGVRTVICEVRSPNGQLTGSVRQGA